MKDRLVQQIEVQLDWGDSDQWSNKDFQELSERIFSHTHKQLSVTTLKRVWGRAASITQPSIATLDILAEFAGYQSWRHFRQSHVPQRVENDTPPKVKSKRSVLGLIVLVVLSCSVWFAMSSKEQKAANLPPIPADQVDFSFQKVTTGYPNTVIFRYDVGDIPFDTISIQQSWDESKRIALTEPQGLVTTTYYYPGYFRTKLLVNDQIVQEKDLYIPTQGWQGLVWEGEEGFSYLKPEQLRHDSTLTVTSDVLAQMNEPARASLSLANLSDNPQINSANFRLETEFRMPQSTERSICQNVRLTMTGTKDVLGLQFSVPGCVGDLMFALNKEMIFGKDHDLSAFGLDLSHWVACTVEVKDNDMSVSLNNQEVFRHQLSSDIGLIGGVQWMFEGRGEIRRLEIHDAQHQINLME